MEKSCLACGSLAIKYKTLEKYTVYYCTVCNKEWFEDLPYQLFSALITHGNGITNVQDIVSHRIENGILIFETKEKYITGYSPFWYRSFNIIPKNDNKL